MLLLAISFANLVICACYCQWCLLITFVALVYRIILFICLPAYNCCQDGWWFLWYATERRHWKQVSTVDGYELHNGQLPGNLAGSHISSGKDHSHYWYQQWQFNEGNSQDICIPCSCPHFIGITGICQWLTGIPGIHWISIRIPGVC